MAANNKMKVFAENAEDQYIIDPTQTEKITEYLRGCLPNTLGKSTQMNTALRTATLIAVSLINYVTADQTAEISAKSSQSAVETYITTGFAKKIKAVTVDNAAYAAVAGKLNSNAGTSSRPVYFANGVPVQCGTSLSVDITGNAATASTAAKLGTNAGSSTRPVYFANGIPVQCGTSLDVDISGKATATETKMKNIVGGSATGLGTDTASKFNSKIQVRSDTSANWSSRNPVLAKGEFGYDETAKAFKLGDGTTTWNNLAFAGKQPTHHILFGKNYTYVKNFEEHQDRTHPIYSLSISQNPIEGANNEIVLTVVIDFTAYSGSIFDEYYGGTGSRPAVWSRFLYLTSSTNTITFNELDSGGTPTIRATIQADNGTETDLTASSSSLKYGFAFYNERPYIHKFGNITCLYGDLYCGLSTSAHKITLRYYINLVGSKYTWKSTSFNTILNSPHLEYTLKSHTDYSYTLPNGSMDITLNASDPFTQFSQLAQAIYNAGFTSHDKAITASSCNSSVYEDYIKPLVSALFAKLESNVYKLYIYRAEWDATNLEVKYTDIEFTRDAIINDFVS